MKKVFCVLLTALLLLSVCACVDNDEANVTVNVDVSNGGENTAELPTDWQGSDASDTTTAEETTAEQTTAEGTTQTSSGDVWTKFY